MEFGSHFLAFLLGGIIFAPIINAIDSVLGHTIANTTRNLAKSTIVLILELADQVKVAGSELAEAFQDLVVEAQADRRTKNSTARSATSPNASPNVSPNVSPTDVEIEAD